MGYIYAKLRCAVILLNKGGGRASSADNKYNMQLDDSECVIVTEADSNNRVYDGDTLESILADHKDISVFEYKHSETLEPTMRTDSNTVLSKHVMHGIYFCDVFGGHLDKFLGKVVVDTRNNVMVGWSRSDEDAIDIVVNIIKAVQ